MRSLAGRAEVDPRAAVDVERLVEVVGLDADPVLRPAALVEGEAVEHAGRVAAAQELLAHEPEALHGGGVAQRAEQPGHRVLGGRVERAAGGEVEPVEIVEGGHAQQAR